MDKKLKEELREDSEIGVKDAEDDKRIARGLCVVKFDGDMYRWNRGTK